MTAVEILTSHSVGSVDAPKTSRQDYLDSLVPPTPAERARINAIQLRKEDQIDRKYRQHTAEERDAARRIQRAYRGHRERRALQGLTLDPSSRWVELIKEWRFRSATAPHHRSPETPDSPCSLGRSPSERAMVNWRRVGTIADHAGAGEVSSSPSPDSHTRTTSSRHSFRRHRSGLEPLEPSSMLLDLRYFLEMVDQKHRYGANLQVYHGEWQRSDTNENFFYWLDHGEGRLLDLRMCSREKLEKERIRYLSKEERKQYLVRVDDEGRLRWHKNDELITTSSDHYQDSMIGIVPKGTDAPTFDDEEVKRQLSMDASLSSKLAAVSGVFRDAITAGSEAKYEDDTSSSASSSSSETSEVGDATLHAHSAEICDQTCKERRQKKGKFRVSPAAVLNHLLRASVRPGTWIYVADTVGRLYVSIKSSGAFQHASFLSGARISSAGTIGIENGKLTFLSPLSGHYRPTTQSFRRFIANLKDQGADTGSLKVSRAYSVLLGMELYGTSKKVTKHLLHPDRAARKSAFNIAVTRRNEPSHPLTPLPSSSPIGTTGAMEDEWRRHALSHDKRGLAKLIDDLNITRERRRGEARSKSEAFRIEEVKER
ncbi:IQ calmodulin-binding motif protein [Cercospora zeina]